MPGLARLQARGRKIDGETGLSDQLCQAFGVPRERDYPLAPLCAEYDGVTVGHDYWLRADPVHLHVGMRGMTLLDSRHIGLTAEEARALAATLAPLFAESGWHLHAPQHDRWYIRSDHAVRLTTTPLDQVNTRLMNSALPTGQSATHLMRLLNDAQVLLHDHPVNQAREARGQHPVNSLWLWGGGERPPVRSPYRQVFAGPVEALALAASSQTDSGPCPQRLADLPRVESALVVLPEFPADAEAAEAIRLDHDWFKPLLWALRLGRIRHVQLALTGREGLTLELNTFAAWKIRKAAD
jgi:hypothetical protein